MGFSRQEHWSGLPCPPPGHLPDTGIEPMSLMSPALAGRFFTTSTTWEALQHLTGACNFKSCFLEFLIARFCVSSSKLNFSCFLVLVFLLSWGPENIFFFFGFLGRCVLARVVLHSSLHSTFLAQGLTQSTAQISEMKYICLT